MRARMIVLFCLSGMLLFAEVGQAKPDYLKRYEAGMQAVEREDWGRAAELMQKALMERANETKRLPQWFYMKPYLPHFYYGLARYHLGDCPQALRSFEISEEQGVLIDRDELYEKMLGLRQTCSNRGARAARSGPGDSTEKRVSVSALAESGDRILEAAAPLAKSEKDQQRIQDTRTGLNVAKVTDEEARRIGDMADGSAPESLDRAIDAFFGGDPGQALAILEGFPEDDDPKVMAHAHLLSSAAAYRLYLLSAETNAGLRATATRSARAFKASGHPIAPPESLFGRRFLQFLASVQ